MSHPNAPLTPEGQRRLAVLIVDNGGAIRRPVKRFQVSPATASKWAKQYRVGDSLGNRSSRPQDHLIACDYSGNGASLRHA